MKAIGAGVGRTGTVSLKIALERLLGGRCYHTTELQRHAEHVPLWLAAVRGEPTDWNSFLHPYTATTDWPGAAFWRSLHEAYPRALVVLSLRESADKWFESVDATINRLMQMPPSADAAEWHAMMLELFRATFTPMPFEHDAAVAAYEAHNAAVRAGVPRDRLLEWQVTDGWEPLCERLGVPVPGDPFPHANSGDAFTAYLDRAERSARWRLRATRLLSRWTAHDGR